MANHEGSDEKAALTEDSRQGGDDVKVEFSKGDGEVKVGSSKPDMYVGLTKEELMKYADDPFWVRVRWILLIVFWLIWVALLVAAIVIIAVAPRCPHRPDMQWWESGAAYRIEPRSFFDSDGDGNGDLKGIVKAIDHLKDLKVNILSLGSIFPSGGKDMGLDVTDFKKVDQIFGTMQDFDDLVEKLEEEGIKLIIDFVPGHTSSGHPWFKKSVNGTAPYSSFYLWEDADPGDEVSLVGGSAWTKHDTKGKFYRHTYGKSEPDLNLANANVTAKLKEAMQFWVDKGVHGFQLMGSSVLLTSSAAAPNSTAPTLLDRFREFVDDLDSDEDIVLIAQTLTNTSSEVSYGRAHMLTSQSLLGLDADCDGECIVKAITAAQPSASRARPVWETDNQFVRRSASRLGSRYINALSLLLLTLHGTPFVYYGAEIGMTSGNFTYDTGKDKIWGEDLYSSRGRDPQLTPMQWSSSRFAGFTDGNDTWLPVNPDYTNVNVKHQEATGTGFTNLEFVAETISLRAAPSFQWGVQQMADATSDIVAFRRQANGFDGYLVAVNMGKRAVARSLRSAGGPAEGTVVHHTHNFDNDDLDKGTVVDLDNHVYLGPGQGVVFRWDAGDAD